MISRRVILLMAVALLAACSRRDPAPKPTTDTPRLVVLSPAMSVTLRDLGKDSLIVGRHAFDLILPKDIPIAGDQHAIDYEKLVKLHPTHILLETGATDIPPRLTELAAIEHWQILALPMLTLDDVRAALAGLDAITGGPSDQGKHLRESFDAAFAADDAAGRRLGRTLPLAWTDPPGVMGPGSFHAQLLSSIGATPLPAEGAAYIEWSLEDVVRTDPDSLILFLPGFEGDQQKALGPLAGLNLRCVRDERVIIVSNPLCHTPSTALADVANFIREQTRSWPLATPSP